MLNHPALSRKFGDDFVVIPVKFATFVPKKFCAEQDNSLIVSALTDMAKLPTLCVLEEYASQIDAKIISLVDKTHYNSLCVINKKEKIISTYMAIFEIASEIINKKSAKFSVFTNVENENIDIFIFEKTNLVFANSFSFENYEKAKYYLQLSFKTVALNQNNFDFYMLSAEFPLPNFVEKLQSDFKNLVLLYENY
jgi:hypothetical protein